MLTVDLSTLGKAVLVSVLVTLSQLLQSRFSVIDNALGIGLLAVGFFVTVFAIDRITDRTSSITKELVAIHNSSARDAPMITTVSNFLVSSNESALIQGDRVEILTNSLRDYDLTRPALIVIADNLRDNVKYIYYLPRSVPSLAADKDSLVSALLSLPAEHRPTNDQVDDNLIFHSINVTCLYNYAVVTKRSTGTIEGYWYIVIPPLEALADKSLVIMTLRRDSCDRLMNVLRELGKARMVPASKRGL